MKQLVILGIIFVAVGVYLILDGSKKNNGGEGFGSLLILSRDIYIGSYGKEA